MNTHEPIDEPLDQDERELARIVRALPAGEPPAALDARILKSASDAVAAAARRRRFAWLGSGSALWSIGSAAAAVLAIGVAWKTINPPTRSLPASAPAPVAADAADEEGVPVEFKEEAPRTYDNSPPPQDVAGRADSATVASKPQQAPPPMPASPTAFPESGLDEHVTDNLGMVAAEPPAPPPPPMSATAPPPALAQAAEAMAAPAASAGAATSRERAEDQALAKSTRDLAGLEADARREQQRQNEAEATRRVQADAQRYPESWLLKIRARWKDGDIEGARASLRLFVAKYPSRAVPDDLKPLLHE